MKTYLMAIFIVLATSSLAKAEEKKGILGKFSAR